MRTILMRKLFLVVLLFGFSIGVVFSSELGITVWKSATCGCCQKWVDYLSDNGFDVVTHDVEDVTSYKRHRLPRVPYSREPDRRYLGGWRSSTCVGF